MYAFFCVKISFEGEGKIILKSEFLRLLFAMIDSTASIIGSAFINIHAHHQYISSSICWCLSLQNCLGLQKSIFNIPFSCAFLSNDVEKNESNNSGKSDII